MRHANYSAQIFKGLVTRAEMIVQAKRVVVPDFHVVLKVLSLISFPVQLMIGNKSRIVIKACLVPNEFVLSFSSFVISCFYRLSYLQINILYGEEAVSEY